MKATSRPTSSSAPPAGTAIACTDKPCTCNGASRIIPTLWRGLNEDIGILEHCLHPPAHIFEFVALERADVAFLRILPGRANEAQANRSSVDFPEPTCRRCREFLVLALEADVIDRAHTPLGPGHQSRLKVLRDAVAIGGAFRAPLPHRATQLNPKAWRGFWIDRSAPSCQTRPASCGAFGID